MKQKLIPSLLFGSLLLLVVMVSAGTRPSAAAPAGGVCPGDCLLYLSSITKPVLDFTVADIEIFQATQRDDNSVPLVAGKTAVARIYAQLLEGTSPANVDVSLTAVRNGSTLGTVNAAGPATVPATPERGNYNSTFNVILPDGWLSGQVQLTATVDAANAFPETNESNNQFGRSVTFNNVPDLQIFLVPIDYTHQGPANPGFYPGQAVDNISDWTNRAYPVGDVEVTMRPDYGFSGDLQDNSGSDWIALLNEMYLLKLSDGYPEDTPIVYYGLVPIHNGSTQWFTPPGIAGIGWISPPGQNFRESVGLNLGANDDTGVLAAHEIGHNLGREHAPCGDPAEPDPSYPYTGASIGQYGTDIQDSSVSFYTPISHVDLMSYCSPEWISDYTYTALYDNQRVQGLSRPSQTADHLVIRASFNDNGLNLAPTYAFPMQTSADVTASDVMVELLDANGDIIAIHPVAVREAEEEGIAFRAVLGTVPLPAAPVAAIRLVADGVTLAHQQLEQPARLAQTALTVSQTSETVTLNWGLPDVPAIVRYTADHGASWTTLAVDVVGGSLSVDVADWLGENGRFELILANTGAPAILSTEWTTP